MIRAGSLYFAIFISFIITLLLGSIILYTFYSNGYADIQSRRDQAASNAVSGITLAIYDSTLLQVGNSRVLNIFDSDDSLDKVTITKSFWGIYHVIKSSVRWKNAESAKLALTGTNYSENEPIALYMADKDRYLSVSGKTTITGDCYLPRLGVRMAYIEGQNFIGEKLINGETKISNSCLPEILPQILKNNVEYIAGELSNVDSLVRMEDIIETDSVECSFNKKTLVLFSQNSINLDHIILKGNIRVVSGKAIYVTSNAKCENIILYAPSIYFASWYKGNLQAFAQDTLIAGERCEFKYPSCLGIINENENSIYMSLGKSSSIVGCLVLYQANNSLQAPYLKIGRQTVVHGMVYCNGTVELLGRVEGSVYCHGFGLNTGSAYYENYLLNTSINRFALSEYYAGSFLLHDYKHAKLIQWLN
jgi:hypothetical protein